MSTMHLPREMAESVESVLESLGRLQSAPGVEPEVQEAVSRLQIALEQFTCAAEYFFIVREETMAVLAAHGLTEGGR